MYYLIPNNNRIFTISDFAKDILDKCEGHLSLTEIIYEISRIYRLQDDEANIKCRNFLRGLIEKNMIGTKL